MSSSKKIKTASMGKIKRDLELMKISIGKKNNPKTRQSGKRKTKKKGY